MNRFRHYVVVFGMVVAALFMIAKIFALTYLDRDFLQAEGVKRFERTVPISTHRGSILDRNGNVLSISTPMYSLWTDPGVDEIPTDQIPPLAEAIGKDESTLKSLLHSAQHTRFVYLVRRVTPEVARRVAELNIPGVRFQTEYRRYYPVAEVAAHVVGVTDINDQGQEGLELSFNDLLEGEPGSRRVLRNPTGQLLKDIAIEKPVVYGSDLELTIDLPLQYLSYQSLRRAVEEHEAVSASLVLVDVSNGDVLALTNFPSYNPNDPGNRPFAAMRNRAVTDLYEPGSTVKPFTVMAALETGRYTPDVVIDTNPGYFTVARKTVEDPRNYGALTLKQVLVKSSQVGASKIALDLERLAVYEALVRAGFDEPPMTGLPGESTSVLSIEELKRDVGRVVLSYGYGIAVTPLQVAQGYLTLATGGLRRQISIVQGSVRIEDERVFDAHDVRTLMQMLEGVVSVSGTASRANIEGFQVAGKTGTVRKLSGGDYDDSRHVSWFVGMVPASNPKFLGVVVVNEPQGEFVGGGTVAAPVFKRVAQHALQLFPHKAAQPDALDGDRDAA